MNQTIEKLIRNEEDNYIFPFFWQHGEDESTLRKYMQVIQDANCRAVCIESRPHPDFVGAGWWRDMDIILDEARKRDMKVWILDDSHFPTGYANGALEEEEELCRQSLVCQTLECEASGTEMKIPLNAYRQADEWKPNMSEIQNLDVEYIRIFEDDKLEGILAVKRGGKSLDDILDLSDQIEKKELCFRVPEGEWRIYFCQLTRNRGPHRNYINMMSRLSCRKLIDAVYEPHYDHYKSDFGKTIAGFFSDEPEIGNGHLYEYGKRIYEMEDQAWSYEVEEELQKYWKENYHKILPLLWEQDFSDDWKARARWSYMDILTRKVEEDFSMQLGEWCREHGVEYIGHLIEDNNQHTRAGSGLGHYFRGISGQDMAGIDDIGGQVMPQGENSGYGITGDFRDGEFYHYVLGKLAASAAAIDPRKKGRAVCEIFGAYGWGEGVKLEKYLIDHFLVRGVNHFVPHAFSPKAFPDPDCPPHFYAHGNNPQYRHFGALMKYTNRMCELFHGGLRVVPVAILYSAEAEWCGDYMDLQSLAKILADHQMDYDFIPADVFVRKEYYRTETDKYLCINGRKYLTLLIPEYQFVTEQVIEAIKKLNSYDFPVFCVNQYPRGICNAPQKEKLENLCRVVGEGNLLDVLRNIPQVAEISLTPENDRIRAMHYKKEQDIYLFVNEGTEAYRGQIKIRGKGECYGYNAWENQIESLDYKETDEDTCVLYNVNVEPGRSMVVVFDSTWGGDFEEKQLLHQSLDKMQEKLTGTMWGKGWSRKICRSIDYPNFGEQELCSIPDKLEVKYPEFSGYVCYENSYYCMKIPEQFILEITDASEGVEVFVNGISAGIQISAPFRYDITSLLHTGINRIKIEVATTLFREMWKYMLPLMKTMGMEEFHPTNPSGINGHIKVWRS